MISSSFGKISCSLCKVVTNFSTTTIFSLVDRKWLLLFVYVDGPFGCPFKNNFYKCLQNKVRCIKGTCIAVSGGMAKAFSHVCMIAIRVFHDKQFWQNICQIKKFWKNKFNKKLPPVGFELTTATITHLKPDA